MSGVNPTGAGSNPPAGGSSTNPAGSNPLTGGSSDPNPAPPTGQPAGQTGSNPQAGGSSQEPGTPQAVPPAVEAEWKRENAVLRKRLEALEAEKKAEADAKLTVEERTQKQLAELQRKDLDHEVEKQSWLLERAVIDEAQARRLHNVSDTVALLRKDFGDTLDYDDQGRPTNVSKLLDRLLEKKPWLVAPEQSTAQQPQTPNSGRVGSAPRTPTGQFAPKPPEPVPPDKWPSLSEIQWSQPRGDLGTTGSNQ